MLLILLLLLIIGTTIGPVFDMNDAPTSRESPETRSNKPEQHGIPRDSWRSEELLGDRPEVLILHNKEVYRLRRTRQGKLILHK